MKPTISKSYLFGFFQASSISILIMRIIASPLFFGIILIAHVFAAVTKFIDFFRYGGEASTYKKDEIKTIQSIYEQIKSNQPKP